MVCWVTEFPENETMRFGTINFNGDAGRHLDENDRVCDGRSFKVNSVGVGGIYVNYVQCVSCGLELEAFENGLAQPQRTTFAGLTRK